MARRSPEAALYRKLYQTTAWRSRRLHQLTVKPLCEWCFKRGIIKAATVAHHADPHKGDREKFFRGALISLCAPCHDIEAQGIEARGYSNAIGLDGWPTHENHPANRS